MTAARLLVVQHESDCPPALFADWLTGAGCVLDVRGPSDLPGSLEEYAGLLVLGGSMDSWDDAGHPHLPHVRALLVEAATDGVPTLGICLGAQLAALALGGRVERSRNGQRAGLYDVGWLPEAATDPLLGELAARPVRTVQWNSDVVTALPPGAVLLAADAHREPQVVRYAETVWGVQFHPEVDAATVQPWADSDSAELRARGEDVEALVAQIDAAGAELVATWRPLAERFARLVATGPARTAERFTA